MLKVSTGNMFYSMFRENDYHARSFAGSSILMTDCFTTSPLTVPSVVLPALREVVFSFGCIIGMECVKTGGIFFVISTLCLILWGFDYPRFAAL